MSKLDQATIDAFKEHGAVPLYGVFDEWVETLANGVDANMAAPSENGRVYEDEEAGGKFLSDYCNWDRIPQYRDFVRQSPPPKLAHN